jgi:hypothetical protein
VVLHRPWRAEREGPRSQRALRPHDGHQRGDDGLDIVVEGDATRVTDEARLVPLAAAYEDKRASAWHFEARDGSFFGGGGEAWVFAAAPTVAVVFAKSDAGGQTRYCFGS